MWSSKRKANRSRADKQKDQLPPPSTARLHASWNDTPFDLKAFVEHAQDENRTVLYLGYGSNLSNQTFRGKRGIKPLSQINVQVPSLRVTFDLPGIPYLEPCFANSGLRDADEGDGAPTHSPNISHEKTPLLKASPTSDKGYRKDRWRKGLVGVVYEVTAEDFAHIIATEGGGTSYQDILVDCYPFASSDPSEPVPWHPTQAPFKAHTLFAPSLPPNDPRGRIKRPDPSYAQPSARYLKLMTDGAAELGLPYEYQQHLQYVRHYRITTWRQRMGMLLLLTFWVPLLAPLFGLGKIFADKKGRFPGWLMRLLSLAFNAVWRSYDVVFKRIFGDGERTLTDGKDEDARMNLTSRVGDKQVPIATLEAEDFAAKAV